MPKKTQSEMPQVADDSAAEWHRFERAVDAAVKSGPKHKTAGQPKERPATEGRVHKRKTRD